MLFRKIDYNNDDEICKHYEIGGRHYILMSIPPPTNEDGSIKYPVGKLMSAMAAGVIAFARIMSRRRKDVPSTKIVRIEHSSSSDVNVVVLSDDVADGGGLDPQPR